MIGLALATGWPPSEVRALRLGDLEHLGEVLTERVRSHRRAEARQRARGVRRRGR